MEKWFENVINDVAKSQEYGDLRTVEECDKVNRWTPVDLILREELNNGGMSAKGFCGITPARCHKAYAYAKTIKQELIDKKLINEKGFNNSGFVLWNNYNF